MKKSTITASIVGGSGYAGGELLRILLMHPKVSVKQTTSQRYINHTVSSIHPNLRGKTSLKFSSLDALEKCNLLFIALPNTSSMQHMKGFIKLADRIIDTGADFRLHDAKQFQSWYQQKHASPELSKKFVYGLCELHRKEIRKAKLIACGGCEATAVILALYPLVKENLLTKNRIIADIKIASSAAGNKPTNASHHPERQGVLRSYKATHHRHQAEIKQELGIDVDISATAVNLVRGILATIHTQVKKGISEKDVWRAYRKAYKDEPFIRIVKQKQGLYRFPEPKLLWGTNYCDIGFEKDHDSNRLVIISAIDNLVKGTAGQAVQAMNVMYGFPETMSLEFTGLHPV